MWQYNGDQRPPFAEQPGPGQESVWDFPRPPSLLPDPRTIRILSGSHCIAQSEHSLRLCETASPPSFYLPPDAIDWSALTAVAGASLCEWKGQAQYWALRTHPTLPIAWSYAAPRQAYSALQDHLAFYPSRVACFVADERARAQAGDFYGGWITTDITGPFKGDPGTAHW